MWTCPKCKAVMQDDAGKCRACGASSEGVQRWQRPPGWEVEPEPFLQPDNADEESPTGPAADVGPEEGMWISRWGHTGARLGCMVGLGVGGLLSGILVIVALTDPLPQEISAASIVFFVLLTPIILGGISSIFWASVGIVLEALVKSIRGRPRGVDRAIARHQEDEDRSARALLQGKKGRPPQITDLTTDPPD